MKKLTFTLVLALCVLMIAAGPVDTVTARLAATRFMQQHSATPERATASLTLAAQLDNAGQPCVYIFNREGGGFIVMSADDNARPVLGYSANGQYVTENIPENMSAWLLSYRDAVYELAQSNHFPPMETAWQQLLSNTTTATTRNTVIVEPLLVTNWNQSPYYNNLCPSNENGQAITGCVATAMGQIMRYWQWPAQGHGQHTYVANYAAAGFEDYGSLTVNYGEATYNYSLMPSTLTGNSTSAQVHEVAKLLYHCGVSVNMMYGQGGSGAQSEDVPEAMRTHFGYTGSTFSYKSGENSWINRLKAELDAGRPVFYSGSGENGGHAFVCDGYDDENYFHFNWGWQGSCNGYFAVSNLNPSAYEFNNYQGAVFGLEPDTCYPYPEIAISGNPVMADANSSVTLVAPEGVSYAWSNNATTQSITVSPSVPKLYTVTVTDERGCRNRASQWVTFADGCELTITMHDSYGDGWQGCALQIYSHMTKVAEVTLAEGANDTAVVPIISGPLALRWKGGYYPEECEFEVSGNCFNYTRTDCPTSTEVMLETEMFCGDIATEFDVTCTESSYEWNGTTYYEPGNYTQILTNATGCDSIVTMHLSFGNGIEENEAYSFRVWPNPTEGQFSIFNPLISLEKKEIQIFDVYGKMISAQPMIEEVTTVDLRNHPAGIYLIHIVKEGQHLATFKMVRE